MVVSTVKAALEAVKFALRNPSFVHRRSHADFTTEFGTFLPYSAATANVRLRRNGRSLGLESPLSYDQAVGQSGKTALQGEIAESSH
jgi:hypothetical protein